MIDVVVSREAIEYVEPQPKKFEIEFLGVDRLHLEWLRETALLY